MSYAKLQKTRAARGDRGPICLTRPRLPSWRSDRDVPCVLRLRPVAARSADWLALQMSIAFKQQLNLAHNKSSVIVHLPDAAICWDHVERAVALLRQSGYVLEKLTQTTFSFDATKSTK